MEDNRKTGKITTVVSLHHSNFYKAPERLNLVVTKKKMEIMNFLFTDKKEVKKWNLMNI